VHVAAAVAENVFEWPQRNVRLRQWGETTKVIRGQTKKAQVCLASESMIQWAGNDGGAADRRDSSGKKAELRAPVCG